MFDDTLRRAGYNKTRSRRLVAEALRTGDRPMKAAEIFRRLKRRVDLASVYRNLKIFTELGLVFTETIGRDIYYYLAENLHHHIVCRECGRIECVPCEHERMRVRGFSDIKHNIQLSGVCNDCRP